MPNKLTQENFIEKANLIHDFKYDYSKINYINSRTSIIIICPIHGEFYKKPDHHLSKKQGCPRCAREKQFPNKINNTLDFIKLANQIHNFKYDYSLVKYNGYKDRPKKVSIICHEKDENGKEHGIFYQQAGNHLNSQGCKKCFIKSTTKSLDSFIKESNHIHNFKYDYNKVKYINTDTKVCIICPEHGEFWKTPRCHITQESGCPYCKKRFSKGENKIALILQHNKIKYVRQYCFLKCKGIRNLLPFDFYLPDYNTCIEFDGRQHTEPVSLFGGIITFKKIQINDKIKNIFCIENKIKLIRIPYSIIRNNNKVQKIILDDIVNNYIS